MSYADKVFVDMCRDIIENGTSTEGEKVRPHWEDGISAYTVKRFGIVSRYDLRKEFPAITLRKTALKSAFDEILWIWQQKSNNVYDLHSHIWDSWADKNGSIGKAYGYQMQVKHQYKEGMMDQVDRVMCTPCQGHLKVEFTLSGCPTCDISFPFFSYIYLQQYSLLLMMIAQCCDMIPGELLHIIADAHIYDRHIPIVKELINREQFPAPKVWLNPEVKDFYSFILDDLHVEDYHTGPQIKNIPIAV